MKIKTRLSIKKLLQFFFLVPSLVFIFAGLLAQGHLAVAAPGLHKQINFQGKLVNAVGTNVVDNTYSVVFTLYDSASGGTVLWDETQNVTTSDGIFQVSLGSVDTTLGNVNFNSDSLYLGIKVGADSEMTPRIRFASVPYAFNAEKFSGLTADNNTNFFTITGGTATSRTLTVNGADITIGSTITPTNAGTLNIQSNGANGLTLDAGGSATLALGTTNANAISIGKNGTTTTIAGGLTVTTGQTLTLNADAFTDLTGSGLSVASNALTVNLTTTGVNGVTSSNSGLEVGSSGLTLLKGCSDGQLLEYTDAGGWACANDDTSAGGGGGSNWTLDTSRGVLRPNNSTLDILFGGIATASAKFAFGGLNTSRAIATFSADLMFEAMPDSSVADQTAWTKISQATAGTIANGGTTQIASISAMAVYNGNVFVGTYRDAAGGAEVYRYEGYNSTWTKVSQATAGTLASGGTVNIGSISAMTVFDGRLYVGTSKINAAEIYRYDGGTTWTKVSGATAGTIGSATNQDGVSSLAVYQGRLYVGTREPAGARLIRWDGGNAWSVINGTAGTFIATNTVGVNAVTAMASMNGALYLGLSKPGDADIVKYTGAATFLALNAATATGSYTINGTAVTAFDEVSALTIYNGNLILGMQKNNGAEVLSASPQVGETGINTFTRLNNAIGQMSNGGTTAIDQIAAFAVYNGLLYVATREGNNAEIYRYTGSDQRFFRVSAGAGQIASGESTGIDGVVKMIATNGELFAGTMELGACEVYRLSNVNINKSYALKFHANPSIVGESGVVDNTASIFYLASASANLSSNDANTGAFIFSHGIQTRNGSYDVAEDYPTRDDTLTAGDLVSIDTNERGFVSKSERAYDSTVIGVYSEKPALRLTQHDAHIDGGRAIPVALAGRVPVKVSTENGVIKAGDYLTSSSTPGVAMKATKAGVVIGQAMEAYAGEEIGKVLTYIKSTSYQGSVASYFTAIDMAAENSGEHILQALATKNGGLVQSDMVIDKLVVTDMLVAKKIKAEQIEGLEFIMKGLKNQNLEMKEATAAGVLGDESYSGSHSGVLSRAYLQDDVLQLNSLQVDGLATISSTLRVKQNGLIEGLLTVIDTLMTKNIIVNGASTFFGDVVFKNDVSFAGHTTVGADTAGMAVIKKETDRVTVTFTKSYTTMPIVNVNMNLPTKEGESKDQAEQIFREHEYRFVVSERSLTGFTIVLNKKAHEDMVFSWIALALSEDNKVPPMQNIINGP